MSDKLKAINFDLDTKKLKQFYTPQTGKRYNKAYYDIKAFMKANDFSHRQGSGYISKHRLSNTDIVALVGKMNKSFPWLKHCVKHIDVTVIERQFDLTVILNREDTIKPTKGKNSPTEKLSNKTTIRNTTEEETITISKQKYETLQKNIEHLNDVIDTTNMVFREHPELKEAFKKAKTETLQRKAEREGGTLNNQKTEIKVSEHKPKQHKPKR